MDSKSKNEDEHPAYASVRDMTYFTILLILDNIWGTDFWKPDAFPVTKLTVRALKGTQTTNGQSHCIYHKLRSAIVM